jgi:hypothetical protein
MMAKLQVPSMTRLIIGETATVIRSMRMSSSGRATNAEHHNTDQTQQMTQISSAQGVALLKT